MKKFLKVFTILLSLLIISLIVESCLRCPERQYGEYSLSSIDILPFGNERIMMMMRGIAGGAENNPHIFRKDCGVDIWFRFTTETIAAEYKPVKSLFIQSAYAWQCGNDPVLYPIDSVISVQVFSDKDFGETHLAGTDIAEFFKIREWDGKTPFPKLTSFEEYLKRPARIIYNSYSTHLCCLITATNVEYGEHNFHFVVKLSDERILEQSVKGILEE